MVILKRNITLLSNKEYDLVIVGGGIFGVCAAWDAALRGLSVALLEKKDFAHGTSANSFKMIHGGIRYLQHADFCRIRRSVKERRAFIRIAPHNAYPLPIVIPIYGHGLKGKEILKAGFFLYDLISYDRNQGISDRERQIPGGHFISRVEVLKLFPGLKEKGLTGAAIFCDGQMYNPPRLALSFLMSAINAGADAANYAEVTGLIKTGGRVSGVQVIDVLTGKAMEVSGKIVLNAAGPWGEELLDSSMGLQLSPRGTYSRDVCFIVSRRLTGKYALAVQGRTKDPDAILSREKRHLFIAPWRNYSLIGVWHTVHEGRPEDFTVSNEEIQGYLDEINEAYPGFQLTLNDVTMWNAGLVQFGENKPGAKNLRFGKRSRIIDHARHHGVEGLVTLIGARFTTARGDAAMAVDIVLKKLNRKPQKPATDTIPVFGGRILNFEELFNSAVNQCNHDLSRDVMRALLNNYGSEYGKVLKYIDEAPALAETIGETTVIKAEIVNAVREEMAQKLGDVVFRRTDLATGEDPGDEALMTCAALMASEQGWDETRIQRELDEVRDVLMRVCVSPSSGLNKHTAAVK